MGNESRHGAVDKFDRPLCSLVRFNPSWPSLLFVRPGVPCRADAWRNGKARRDRRGA